MKYISMRQTDIKNQLLLWLNFLIFIVILPFSDARAAEDDVENLVFKGTVITPPPCTLNGGNTIYISFGEKVGINKVGSGVYRQPIELGLECGENSSGWQLSLTWTGTPASFDINNATVVSSEQSALGVKLFSGTEPLPLDTPIKLSGDTLPELEAVLVKKDDTTLEEGDFSAKGTFRIEYQ